MTSRMHLLWLRLDIMLALGLVLFVTSLPGWVPEAGALPAFARKYKVNCNVCHTRQPRLNKFGEQFLENGYQMPGTDDGGIVGKLKYGDLTLDQVSNYFSVLFATSGLDHYELKREIEGSGDQTELGTPTILRLFTAGTITNNVGFFVDVTSLFGRSSELDLGRAYVTLNNLGGMNWGHLRVGRLDPSAFFSMARGRPQFPPIGPKLAPPFGAFNTPTVNRWALMQSAYASKFYGLFDRNRNAIQPYDSTLYHSPEEVGIDIHGRPFGDWFLYQAGILNGGNERAGDSNNSKDWYVMTRFDYARSDYFSANLSGFAYFGNHNAKVAGNTDVSRSRYGVGARVRYKWLDVYGAYTIDRVTDLPSGMGATFDSTATGVTVEAHALVTDRLLLGTRYDHMDAGGLLATRTSATFVGLLAKYYLRPNMAISLRDDFNVRDAEGGTSAARNLRNRFAVDLAIVF